MRIINVVCLFLMGVNSLCALDLTSHIKEFETPMVKYLKPIEIVEGTSGMEGIDCIYVINLDERPEKWQRVKGLCDEKGLRVNRVSGVNGWQLSDAQLKELCGPYKVHMPKGHYGCLLSHLSILKDAFERGFELIWVLEDDVEFVDDIEQIPNILKRLNKIDPAWHIFYTDVDFRKPDGTYLKSLAYNPRFDQQLQPKEYYQVRRVIDEDLMQIRQRYATTSMLISRSGIKKILDYFTHVYVWEALDGELHWIPGIREYSSRRDIVSNWSKSPHCDTVRTPPLAKKEYASGSPKKVFELAMSLMQENNHELALKHFKLRAGMGGDKMDLFWSLYQVGLLQQTRELDPKLFCDSYYKAYHQFPERAEPLYRLALHYRSTGNYLLGYLIANFGRTLPCPKGAQFVDEWIYQWGLNMELSLCAFYLGKYEECKTVSDQMLANPQLPEHVRQQVLSNLKWVYPKLQKETPGIEKKESRVKKISLVEKFHQLCNYLRRIFPSLSGWGGAE